MKYSENVHKKQEELKKLIQENKAVDASGANKEVGKVELKENHTYRVDYNTGAVIETDLTNPEKAKKKTLSATIKSMKEEIAKMKKAENKEKTQETIKKESGKAQRRAEIEVRRVQRENDERKKLIERRKKLEEAEKKLAK